MINKSAGQNPDQIIFQNKEVLNSNTKLLASFHYYLNTRLNRQSSGFYSEQNATKLSFVKNALHEADFNLPVWQKLWTLIADLKFAQAVDFILLNQENIDSANRLSTNIIRRNHNHLTQVYGHGSF